MILMISCINTNDRYVNVYSGNPYNINNPGYLIINKNGSYFKIWRYGDEKLEYFNQLEEYGHWDAGRGYLNLYDTKKDQKTEKFKIIPLENNAFGLKPTLGVGRHSNVLYEKTTERNVLKDIYRKEGSYWKKIHIPIPPPDN